MGQTYFRSWVYMTEILVKALLLVSLMGFQAVGMFGAPTPLEWRAEAVTLRRQAYQELPRTQARAQAWVEEMPNECRSSEADQALAQNILAEIASLSDSPGEALAHALQALKHATKANNACEIARAKLILSDDEDNKGESDKALDYAREALVLMEQTGDKTGLAEALKSCGYLCYELDQTEQALRYNTRLDELAERMGDPLWLAIAKQQQAWILFQGRRLEEAIARGAMARDYARKAGSPSVVSSALQVMAAATGRSGDKRKAEELFREGLELARGCREPIRLATALCNLAINLQNQDRPLESLGLLDEALAIVTEHPSQFLRQELLHVRSEILIRLNRITEAMLDAERCFSLAAEMPHTSAWVSGAECLAQACSASGDYKRAYELAQEAKKRMITLNRTRVELRVAELAEAHTAAQRKSEIDRLANQTREQEATLRFQEERQNLMVSLMLIGALVLVLAALLLTREKRTRRRLSDLNQILARTEQSAREHAAHFQSLFEQSGLGMVLTDENGLILRANPRFGQMLEKDLGQLEGRDIAELVHPEDRNAFQTARLDLGEEANAVAQFECRLPNNRQAETWIRCTVALLRSHGTGPKNAVLQMEDITFRRQCEAEVLKARDNAVELARSKSQFLASMSHEIRTPMNGVIGLTTLLSQTQLNPEQREMLRLLDGSAESLLRIINDILDLSKIEAGKMRIEQIPFDPAQVVGDCTLFFKARAEQKGLRISCSTDKCTGLGAVGDPVRLRQILDNFLSNALKFTEKGSIRIGAEIIPEGQPRLRIEVADTGIGIPKDKLDTVFEAFEQADASHSRRFGGTGLGLAICQNLAKLMNGSIGVSSEPNAGSLFWVELPLRLGPGTPPTRAKTEESVTLASLEKLRLLVAEDNTTNRFVLEHLLRQAPYSLTFANDGQHALDLLAAEHFDLILMDCQMPGMDGFEATRRIRSGLVPGVRVDIPIIALTAYAMDSDREKCLEVGMNDYLSKPLRLEALEKVISRHSKRTDDAGQTPTTAVDNRPPAQEPSGLLDEEYLQSFAGVCGPSGRPLVIEMTELFAEDFPTKLRQITESIAGADTQVTATLAHTLAGSCANIGATRLRATILELEKSSGTSDPATTERLLQQITSVWNETLTSLRTREA